METQFGYLKIFHNTCVHAEQNRALRVKNSQSRILLRVISASLGNSNKQGDNSQCLMIHVHLFLPLHHYRCHTTFTVQPEHRE